MRQKTLNYLTFILLFLFFLGNFRTYMVLGESDLPTFYNGDKVIINRSAYDLTLPFTNLKLVPWRSPSRGDMILCHLQKKDNGAFWLKRIIGIPGDTIQIKGNRVFINHRPLKYEQIRINDLHPDIAGSLGDIVALESGFGMKQTVTYSNADNIISNLGPLIVPAGHYFVLGDNRLNSLDSRFLGQVPRHAVFGKYLFRIYRKNNL